jgi:hypothetical protein
MCGQMDVRMPKTFFLAHDKVIGAGFPENKRLDGNASHPHFGIPDHDAGLKTGLHVPNLVGNEFQKHIRLFEDEIFYRNVAFREQCFDRFGDFGIVIAT